MSQVYAPVWDKMRFRKEFLRRHSAVLSGVQSEHERPLLTQTMNKVPDIGQLPKNPTSQQKNPAAARRTFLID